MATYNYRIKLNGTLLHGQVYTHLQNAISAAQSIPLEEGDIVQVIDDGIDKEIVKLELKGSAHASNA